MRCGTKSREYRRIALPFWHAFERDSWYNLAVDDESRFFLHILPRGMWTLSTDDVVTKTKFEIQSKKFICAIVWNPSSFDVVDRLRNDLKMYSHYFVTNPFIPFE
jgi:hypothetical protein